MKHALSFKVFPNMLATFGLGGVFFNASLMSVFGVVFSYFFIPETKDKSIYELETMFMKKESNQDMIHNSV